MFEDKQIQIAKYLTDSGLVPIVFHSVFMLKNEKGDIYSAYSKGDEFHYVGADDRKARFGYIRRVGEGTVERMEKVGGCSKGYWLSVPFKLVIFNDHETADKNELLRKIMGFTFMQKVKLRSFQDSPFEVAKVESLKMDYNFGGNTFFASIDFSIVDLITDDTCAMDCNDYPNPIVIPPIAIMGDYNIDFNDDYLNQ